MPSAIGGVLGGIFGSPGSSTNGSGNSSSAGINNSSSNNSSNATSSTNPNLPGWYNKFIQGLVPAYNQLSSLAGQPVIGQQQIGQFAQNLNQQVGNATQQTMSQLARAGALNSGRAAQAITDLQNGKMATMNNYLAQVPQINQSQMFNQGSQLLGQGFNFRAPYGETTTNLGNNWSNLWNTSSNTSAQNQKGHNGGSGLLGSIFG